MENKKKFPISTGNKECIGPCYPKNKYIMHPNTLQYVTNIDNPFCPVEPYYNNKTKKYEQVDICLVQSKLEDIDQNQIELSFLVPTFQFSCEHFLKIYYDIFSFEGAVDYITQNIKDPIFTNFRIIDCAWKIYGLKIDLISEELIDLYMYFIKKTWVKHIYSNIYNYITVKEDIFLEKNTDDADFKKIEKINYIIKKICTRQMIFTVIQEYLYENKSNWNDIVDHNELIKEHLVKHIMDKIELTLK